jgi:hypothetical protein
MKSRSISAFLLVAVLVLASLACELSAQPITRKLEFVSIAVIPAESDGSALVLTVTYTTVGDEDQVEVSCNYQSSSGTTSINPKQRAVGSADVRNSALLFSFSLTQPGEYQAYCTSSDGGQSATAPFRIVETEEEPSQPPQPQEQPLSPNTACQWQVAGTWNITQVNNYHPTFVITQNGTTLTGTATLTEGEASMGGYTRTTGTGEGSVDGNVFTFVVTWPPKTDGQVISGTYTGTITAGRIDGQDNIWYGTGPSICVNP